MAPSDPPTDPPSIPDPPPRSHGPDQQTSRRKTPDRSVPTSPADDVLLRLDDLAAEFADHRSETRAELSHLGRLVRAEGLRLSRELSREVGRVLNTLGPGQVPAHALTRRHLLVANVATLAAIALVLWLML